MKLRPLRTVRHKILVVVLVTTLVALIVALGGIVAYNLRADHQALISDMTTQSELLGHMTAPALAFDDKQLASQNLGLLRFRPNVRAAAIYDARGALFATYAAPGEQALPPAVAQQESERIEGPNLVLFKRVVDDKETLGTVYLRANYELADRLWGYLGIAAAVTMAAMLIALLLSARLQKMVTGPILAIAGIAREVVEQRDYSRRAKKISDDEVGLLVESFNGMLSEIERRTHELENSNREIAREVGERSRAQQQVMQLNTELEVRVRDRTAQLEATNAELVSAKAGADKANHAKSAFLSSMSHELRTPLNAILGFTQLLDSPSLPSSPEKKKEFTAHILKAGKHLLMLINEVLDLAKVESGTLTLSLEPVALSPVMEECRQMMEPLAGSHNVRMIFPPDDGLHVISDRTRLKQVLLNLLSNAIKYNRRGGTVIVAFDCADRKHVRMSIQDTGAGLDSQKMAQLFQPFNRLGQETGAEEGTGIGLVVTKRLVELMGGEIGVSSTVGNGSTFWIRLKSSSAAQPVAGSNSAQLVPRAESVQAAAPRRTMLYVEDNPANLKLIQEIISFRPDLLLLTAADASLGIELARAHQPEVILMDINLPDINGNEALIVLRKGSRTAHIPVIALTANAMPRDVANSMAFGFFRYLTKPINIDEFLEALDSALEFARISQTEHRRN